MIQYYQLKRFLLKHTAYNMEIATNTIALKNKNHIKKIINLNYEIFLFKGK